MTQKQLTEKLLEEITSLKKELPNGEFQQLMDTVMDLKTDMSDLKFKLLNPEDGIVVRTNKSLETSEELEEIIYQHDRDLQELTDLIKWKNTVSKVLWILFTSIVGLVVKIISMGNGI